MKTTIVKQLGIGSGAGDKVEVLTRKEIESILDDINLNEVFKVAHEAWSPLSLNGEAQLSLKTGKLMGAGYSNNSQDQACDSVYIHLWTLDENFEDIEDYIDKDSIPYEVETFIEWDEILKYYIAEQLEEWYK